jgi:hypothetical protein
MYAGCFLGWAGNLFLWRALGSDPARLLPVLAAFVPAVQSVLFPASATLTARWGPAVTEALTVLPVAAVSAACVATYLDSINVAALIPPLSVPRAVADAAPGLTSWAVFRAFETASAAYLPALIGKTFLLTRVGLELALAGAYAVLAPSRLLLLAVPALMHAALLNTHVMHPAATAALDASLAADGFSLLARQESVTGYVSVLENTSAGYRVLRSDHSLLGGNWVRFETPTGIAEPIYAVFIMLEAVRLVRTVEPIDDAGASALVMWVFVYSVHFCCCIYTIPSSLLTNRQRPRDRNHANGAHHTRHQDDRR